MSKEIIIHAESNQTRIAIVENGELIELYIENPENERTLGDIHLGRVRRTMNSIQAAFIDIGQKQDAFLHYSDLADNLPSWLALLEHDAPSVTELASQLGELPSAIRRRPKGRRRPPSGGSSDEDEASSDKDAPQKSRSSRDRRQSSSRSKSTRRQSSSRGKKPREESDQTDESAEASAKPSSKSSRRGSSTRSRPAQSREAKSEGEAEDSKPKSRSSRSSRSTRSTSKPATEARSKPVEEGNEAASERGAKPRPKSRSSRSRRPEPETRADTAEDTPAPNEAASERETKPRPKSRSSRSRRPEPETQADAAEDTPPPANEAPQEKPKSSRARPSSSRSRGTRTTRAKSTPPEEKPDAPARESTPERPIEPAPSSRASASAPKSDTPSPREQSPPPLPDAPPPSNEPPFEDQGKGGERRGKHSRGTSSRRKNDKGGSSNGQKRDDANQPRPETHLRRDQKILVKVVKEPISQKGSRVSTDISLAGRFLVLVPLANYVAVSKKIFSYKERRRLRALARSLLPEGFGVIVRTVAEGKKAKELDTDLRLLLDKWKKIEKKLEGSPEPPVLVHEDVNMASSVIRDLFSDDYDRILIDDSKLYRNVKNYIQAIAPHMVPNVQLHRGRKDIFKSVGIADDVRQAFQSRVDLPSGGYLFIEHTEAMHVIDVNSGRAGRGLSQEVNSLKVDLEAVRSIARQVRLRDLGGIIVVDFIDLREEKNRRKVFNELRREFRKDRAVTKVLPMSDFGLVEITRQRLRPSITTSMDNEDGSSATNGAVDHNGRRKGPPVAPNREIFFQRIEKWLSNFKKRGKGRSLILKLHPFTAAFMKRQVPSYTTRWFIRFFLKVKIREDETLDPLSFQFLNPKTGAPFSRSRSRGRNRSGRRQGQKRSSRS